jgi:hypothetical protein
MGTPTAAARYLLVKGWCGFADRLQCLSYAIWHAKKYNRILCIDWTDEIWAGNQREEGINFDTFFDLVDVPGVIALPDLLLQLLADGEVSVHPESWKHTVDRRPGAFMLRDGFATSLQDDLPHTLVVYASVGYRVFHSSNICANIRVRQPYRGLIINALHAHAHMRYPA